jgi:hypothetical protein
MNKTYRRTLGPCHRRRGIERDNCPACEGTGRAIDFSQFHKPRDYSENPLTVAEIINMQKGYPK